jgi:hypothetical protein
MPNKFETSLNLGHVSSHMFFGPFQLNSLAQIRNAFPPSSWRQCEGCIATYLTVCPLFHRAPSRACFFCTFRKMPRKKGTVNYKNDVLINIIEEILPNGELGWEAVAIAYKAKSNEEMQQDTTNVKKHWMTNLCNSMKNPTGWTGKNGDRICRCIAIKKKIMRKTHSGFLGVLSDKYNVANNFPIGSADEGGLDDEIDDDVIETRSVLNTLIELDNLDNNGEPDDGMHPVSIPPPFV